MVFDTSEIRRRMRDSGVESFRLCRELGITDREVRILLDGKCVPSWEHLVKIAGVLGCSVNDLIVRRRHEQERRNL